MADGGIGGGILYQYFSYTFEFMPGSCWPNKRLPYYPAVY